MKINKAKNKKEKLKVKAKFGKNSCCTCGSYK
jgi:hypothetical protein